MSRKRARNAGTGVKLPSASAAVPQARDVARVAALDALRGLAILAMVAYHFSFDLNFFGVTRWDFYHDAFWLNARTMILSSFLLIAGVSLVLAQKYRPSSTRFWRHVAIIATCAFGVSAASYLLFPQSWIWFGVLHAIAASLILARPLVRRPALALVIGVIVIAAGNLYAHPAFDSRALGWIGFMTAKPRTEDYVPLFPWFGVLLLGIAAGHALVRSNFRTIAFAKTLPRGIAWIGRHSLAVYMVHQPLLIGTLYLVAGR
ncbi:MAG: heparan-alpha-glucosaminide N-acetyltransferase [Betaproteobacteria bacterium]